MYSVDCRHCKALQVQVLYYVKSSVHTLTYTVQITALCNDDNVREIY